MFNKVSQGLRDGLPIALGYLPVSFTFGMMAVSQGMPAWFAVAVSMLNLTSAGQFAGLPLILSAASAAEMALTQLIINLRYALMSLSLTQKVDPSVKFLNRLGMSFGITDEIFAVSSVRPGTVGPKYFYALMLLPYLGWAFGTLLGAAVGSVLPPILSDSLSIAIYGMFIAIIIPAVREHRSVPAVAGFAAVLSSLFYWLPALRSVSSGFVIIICAVAAAAMGALLFPLDDEPSEKEAV